MFSWHFNFFIHLILDRTENPNSFKLFKSKPILEKNKMPISRSEFESGKVLSEVEKAIVAYLERNRNNAYTMGEIMDGINFQTDFRDLWKAVLSGIAVVGLQVTLNNLVTEKRIRVNIIQGTYYYMAK